MKYSRPSGAPLCIILAGALLGACTPKYFYTEDEVPEVVNLSPRLRTLFAQTKVVCIGRYALEMPVEAKLRWGEIQVNAPEGVVRGGERGREERIVDDIARIKERKSTAEIIYEGAGPADNSKQVRYYLDEYDKKRNFYIVNTYLTKGELTFFFQDAPDEGEPDAAFLARHAALVKSLRLRQPEEMPPEPGFCTEGAFTPGAAYGDQEMVSAGIRFPSLPDVTFSLSSNKNAYMDYNKDEFEQRWRKELSLLERIRQAQEMQGAAYPSRTVLREGKRRVQHWHGEESLFRRKDGVHDFEWAFVGTPTDVANPSEYGVHMFTKVAHNRVGAAKAASLSDDEAVALWDKLLSGLKFRVKVPGAPEGSYYLPRSAAEPGAKP